VAAEPATFQMTKNSFQEWVGAHAVQGRHRFEMQRALGRAWHGVAALLIIAATSPWRDGAFGSLWVAPVLAGLYVALGTAQYLALKRWPDGLVALQYFTMFTDGAAFAVLLCDAPTATAFLSPYLIFLTVPVGLRYGDRAFWFACAGMVLTAAPVLFLGHPFWRVHTHLALALAFLALLLGASFGPVLRKLHDRHRQAMEESRIEALEAAMVTKSAFLARVSHQLRSPLQAIVSSLELMEAPSQQAMRHKLVENISASASKLSMELRDLLTIARAEAWQLQLEPSTFDAGMILESVASEICADGGIQDARILKVVPQDPLFVVADCDKIVQVLTNIAKHVLSTSRAPSLVLTMKGYDSGSRCVTFIVEEAQAPASTPTASPAPTPDRAAGRHRDELNDSLSLTLVRTLVEFLGGTVAPGGTSPARQGFSLSIPCEPVAEDEGGEWDGAATRVLLVTESERARLDVKALVERLDYEVECVSSVPVAANRLALKAYALVLVDMHLPRSNGKRLAMGIKNGGSANGDAVVLAFNARATHEGGDKPWPFDAVIAGAPGDGPFAKAISSLLLAKSPH
jgi:signal transduction histidine kinase/CheY-like chemotaxis protein